MASLLAGTVAVLVAAACSGPGAEDGTGTDRLESIRPSATASDLAPAAAPPPGFRTVTAEGFTIAVPEGWEERTTAPQEGPRGESTTTTGFRPPGGDTETWQGLSVVVVENDPVPVTESSEVLASTKQDVAGATDVTRRSVEWPGASEAVVVDWTEEVRSTPVRYRQLMLRVGASTTVNVVALTREDLFADGDAASALRTVALTPEAA